MAQLLVRPFPYDDESPGGFLLRVSQGNGWRSPSRLINKYLPRNYGIEVNLIALLADAGSYGELCARLGLDRDRGAALCYPQKGVTRHAPHYWRGIGVPWTSLRLANPAICPQCVEERGYLKSAWDHQIATSCVEHGILLVDKCPACGHNLAWNRQSLERCTCGFDLRRAKRIPVDITESAYLEALIARGEAGEFDLVIQFFEALRRIYSHSLSGTHKQLAMDKAVRGVRAPDRLAQELMEDWADCAFGLPGRHPRIELMPLLASHSARIRDVARQALSLIDPSILEALEADRALFGSAIVREACAALGLPQHITTELIESKALRSVRPDNPNSRVSVTIRSLNNLLIELGSRQEASDRFVPVMRFLRGRDLQFHDVIELIRTGKIRCGGYPLTDGLAGLLVEPPASRQIAESIPDSSDMTIADAAKRLEVPAAALTAAIRGGLLKPVDTTRSGRRVRMIPAESLDAFTDSYVYAKALGEAHGARPGRLVRQLDRVGVKPVVALPRGSASWHIFKRSHLARIDWEAVVALRIPTTRRKPGKTNAGTPETMGITPRVASEKLGISVRKVKTLIDRGLIKVIGQDAGIPIIDPDSLQHFQKTLHDEAYIPIVEAAALVGESRSAFSKRWVSTGLITLIDLGVGLFVHKAEVATVLDWKSKYITANEFSAGVSRNRSLIPHLRRKGLIQPAQTLMVNGEPRHFYDRAELFRILDREAQHTAGGTYAHEGNSHSFG